MAEKYETGKWEAVVCNGFTAVNVLDSTNVEELGWDYTEMELDPTGTCGLFDGMLLDWGETVAPDFSRARGHFPDATVAAWAAARSVNESDGNLGIKERM